MLAKKTTKNQLTLPKELVKFSLRDEEIKTILLEEVLPFFEVVEIKGVVKGACQDPDDDKFPSCAVSASAVYLVSGDKVWSGSAVISPLKFWMFPASSVRGEANKGRKA